MTRAGGLVGLVAAALFGCVFTPTDFKGRSCSGANPCPDGYRCDMDSMTCSPLGGVDAGSNDAGPRDAGLDDAGPNDAGPNDAGFNGSCTPYKAGGCQTGENCVFNSATQAFSCAKAGSTAAWYSCSAQSQCAAGTACVDNGGDQRYYCKPFCEEEADCEPYTSPGTTSCTTNLYDGLTQIAGVRFCAASARAHLVTTMGCVPYQAGGCPIGQNCVYNRTLHNFLCAAAGTTTAWYSCTAQSQCAAGTACVDNNGDQQYYCKPFCVSEDDCKPYTTPGVTSCTLNLYDGDVQLRGAPFCAADHRAHLL